MFAEFKHSLRRMSGSVWGWGIGLGLYALMLVYFYEVFAKSPSFLDALSQYPQALLKFFGELADSFTPRGFVDTYYYLYMSLIVGIFSVVAGANMLAADEEKGYLDLVLSQPVSRLALFWGRWLALAAATAGMLLISWLGWLPLAARVGLHLTPLQFLLPNVPLFAVLMWFASLALLLSMVLPASGNASALAGGLLAANWLLRGLADVNDSFRAVMRWTPLHFYQGGLAVDGLKWTWLAGLLVTALVLSLLAMVLFQRRDIRVGGERGWAFPGWKRG